MPTNPTGATAPGRNTTSRRKPAHYPEPVRRKAAEVASNWSTARQQCERRSDNQHDGSEDRDCGPEPRRNDAAMCPKEQLRQMSLQHRITPELSRTAKRFRLE